jgi:hypothetical protein
MTTDALEAATEAYRAAQQALDSRRQALAAAIVAAANSGVRQTEIVRITGYTREHIRQVVKAAEQG